MPLPASGEMLELILDFGVCRAQAMGSPSSQLAGAEAQLYVAAVNDTQRKGNLGGCQLPLG